MPRSRQADVVARHAARRAACGTSRRRCTVVFCVSRRPTISTSSPTLTTPRSMRPVATVPRPVIVNTSSTGIRNGLSTSRFGSRDERVARVHQLARCDFASVDSQVVALQRLERRAADDRGVVAGVACTCDSSSPQLHLDEVQQLLVALADHVALVQEHHDRRHARPDAPAGCARASAASDRPARSPPGSRRPSAPRP